MNQLEAQWQAAIRKIIPGVIVRQDFSIPEEDIYPFLDVYMIPNERQVEFQRYRIDNWEEWLKRENLPDVNLLCCSTSETKRCYPAIYAQAQREARQSASAKSKTVRPAPKPRAKKSAPRVSAASRR